MLKQETTEINREELEMIAQRSEEWSAARIGKMTSSEHYKLVADCKREMTPEELANRPSKNTAKTIVDVTLLSTGALTYIEETAAEIITGISSDSSITTKEMEWGILHEPEAIQLYEAVTKSKVDATGSICYKPLFNYVSGSPDGLVGLDTGIEIKCPYNNVHHLKNLRMKDWQDLKELRTEYYWQCISGMLLTGRKFWDFASYSPKFPFSLQLHIVPLRYEDVQDDIRKLAIKLKFAVKELERILEELNYDGEVAW